LNSFVGLEEIKVGLEGVRFPNFVSLFLPENLVCVESPLAEVSLQDSGNLRVNAIQESLKAFHVYRSNDLLDGDLTVFLRVVIVIVAPADDINSSQIFLCLHLRMNE
jgi:hypothetical protein